MIFDDQFIENVKTNPIDGVLKACAKITSYIENVLEWDDSSLEILLEAWALFEALEQTGLINITLPNNPLFTGTTSDQCVALCRWLGSVEKKFKQDSNKLKLELLSSKYKIAVGNTFCYEFSQGDLDRVQDLINILRKQISESKLVDEHKQRLLRRLEKMQSELHKKVSDLDRFWGLIGDAGVVLGKLGNDAKPIVDRIREISNIVWNTQSKAEELPSGTSPPMLENKSAQEKTEEI